MLPRGVSAAQSADLLVEVLVLPDEPDELSEDLLAESEVLALVPESELLAVAAVVPLDLLLDLLSDLVSDFVSDLVSDLVSFALSDFDCDPDFA